MESELLNVVDTKDEPLSEDKEEKSFEEIMNFLQNISNSTNKIEENLKSLLSSQNSKTQESIKILNEKLGNLDTFFLNLKEQQIDLSKNLKRSLNIERKIKEERDNNNIREQKEIINQLNKKIDNLKTSKGPFNIIGRLGMVNMFLEAVTSNNKKTNRKKFLTFDAVERQIRSVYCQGEIAIKLVNRLKESLNLSNDNNSENILQLFRSINQKLGTEKKNIIPEFVKNEVLSDLDDAEMEYLRKNRSHKSITKSTINRSFEKIEAMLSRNPPSYMLKDIIEKLRKNLMNSNLTIDDSIYRQQKQTYRSRILFDLTPF